MKNILDKPIKAKTLKKKLEKSLQNNKPSIELIEKLDFEQSNQKQGWITTLTLAIEFQEKINQVIDTVNEIRIRLNNLDEEDNN